MVTKICKFSHKIYYKLVKFNIYSRFFALSWGFWGVGQSNGVIQIFARPTFIAIVSKIAKFQQEIGV